MKALHSTDFACIYKGRVCVDGITDLVIPDSSSKLLRLLQLSCTKHHTLGRELTACSGLKAAFCLTESMHPGFIETKAFFGCIDQLFLMAKTSDKSTNTANYFKFIALNVKCPY